MTSRRDPTDSVDGESWVLVSHEEHRDERHPQYNEDNESSTQMAGAVAATDDNHERRHVNNMNVEVEGGHLAMSRRTESNGETETASTDTMTGLNLGDTQAVNIHPTGSALSENSLRRHERELCQGFTASIPQWVEGTTGYSLCAHNNDLESSMLNSMVIGSGRSKASTVMSLDHDLSQTDMPQAHDFSGMGGWC
ncbi:hypothetical protein B0T16DRAFT_384504 [Cercophora newfieldiana]|uniref:Uncharacterized protein n=1 Tax=Cercophora newfieldiana TaxID=92897 RepID=A0AA39YNB4_9PEZI|nr:hypothetical protein B0T16DRAFT_384504 [Cercophora newfieldiana]